MRAPERPRSERILQDSKNARSTSEASANGAPLAGFAESSRARRRGGARKLNGGVEGSRTLDLRIANATLYQLSYNPTNLKYPKPAAVFKCA